MKKTCVDCRKDFYPADGRQRACNECRAIRGVQPGAVAATVASNGNGQKVTAQDVVDYAREKRLKAEAAASEGELNNIGGVASSDLHSIGQVGGFIPDHIRIEIAPFPDWRDDLIQRIGQQYYLLQEMARGCQRAIDPNEKALRVKWLAENLAEYSQELEALVAQGRAGA